MEGLSRTGSMNSEKSDSSLTDNLICTVCTKTLVPSIKQCRNGHIICGRCDTTIDCSQCKRPFDIEVPVLAQLLSKIKFRCSNKSNGCSLKLYWTEIRTHEIECDWRSYTCPVANTCDWKGNAFTVQEHLRNQHKKDVQNLSTRQLVDTLFVNSGQRRLNRFIFKFDSVFKVQAWNDATNVHFAVYYIGEKIKSEFFYYTVRIILDGIDDFKLTNSKPCLMDYMENDTSLDKKSSCIILNTSILDNFSTCYETNSMVDYEIDIAKTSGSHLDEILIEKLKCPVCLQFMMSMINFCVNGHSFCHNCRLNIRLCPICRAEIGTARNYHLETVCQTLRTSNLSSNELT